MYIYFETNGSFEIDPLLLFPTLFQICPTTPRKKVELSVSFIFLLTSSLILYSRLEGVNRRQPENLTLIQNMDHKQVVEQEIQ
jgi:hypothetical protein